jgi:thiol:disulfide interchange protein DsbD
MIHAPVHGLVSGMFLARAWHRFSRLAVAALAVLFIPAAAVAQLRGVPATLTPLVEHERAAQGATVRVALQVALPDGFHVQSNKPRDPLLIPTVLTIDAPAGVAVKEIVFPKPVEARVVGFDQPLSVFEREFVIGVQFILGAGASGQLAIPAHLRYQACNDTTCFAPKTADTQWTLQVLSSGSGPSPTGTGLGPDQGRTRTGPGPDQGRTGTGPGPDQGRTPTGVGPESVFAKIPFGTGEAPGAPAPAAPRPSAAPVRQGDLTALDNFTILGTTGGYQGSSDFLKFIRNAESGVKERGLFEGRGPLAILLIVLIGGLALNLTPCVLPMIPINLAIIGAGTRAGSRARGFLLGGAYGAAMAIVYGVLGLVVILTAGTFGTINSSAWFNLGIAVLFVALGLAMFDVITIDFSRFSSNMRFADSSRGTFLLAFTMGAVAALLAGACVAPVVIEVVLFSSNLYAAGTRAALTLPFFLGLGMAIPWPIAGAGLAALPKPGAWMVRVKQVFGVFILATAAYYGYEAYGIFANRFVDASEVQSSVQEKLKAGWTASLADGLASAKRDGKPVLIDMWATWCKNCLTMDKTTLEDPAVTSALAGYVKIKFQAETPDEQPTKAVMQRFDAVGLPAYVILKPKS